ncbi:SDR family oxidoreductase [Microbaculum marinisediminis]|uniref:SDR family oxidoreductase n=1 Tax=Microbaculum marinisediminis TaxID=2931392 RepID=A0AAW5QUQ6_9HYPH|nr:SDR family oxidoreductase [Microbaculum sp. A6E488]MCT8971655.1 SDR family oxidoreductase [Microbaculum sp. A6E488]
MAAAADGKTPARRVLVTGGARGLGRAIVHAMAASGHDVTFTYNASPDKAETTLEELRTAYPNGAFEAHSVDLSDRGSIDEFVSLIEDETFYGLVHNAGLTYDSLAAVMDQDRAEAAMQVNFWSMTRLAAGLVRRMTRARSGRIVVIGSVIALRGTIGNSAYGASKAALLGYVRTLALETARRGVTVNFVAPGFIDTDMLAPYADYHQHMESQIPAGRFAAPEEIANLVDFLMSPGAGYITGAVLPVDGGLTAAIPVHR